MIALSLAEIAAAVGGVVHGDPSVVVDAPATLDSRAVEPGGLFVAIAGEHVDGHAYAAAARAAGAAAVLGTRPTDAPTVVVDDVVVGLGRLARHVRDRLPAVRVLAMTGSQGKTGTKDYLAAILSSVGPTVATAGNLNNELGVPLTVLRATPETRYLVVEMGARHVGNISYLCEIARPDVAAVLNVGTAHIGEFGSQEAIAQAKGELVEALDEDGIAVLNADDPAVAAMGIRTRARVVLTGVHPNAHVRAEDVAVDAGRARFTLVAPQGRARVLLRLVGPHHVGNALAAAAVALELGGTVEGVAAALGAATPASRWRMELAERPDGVTVVNDAYNANPESMRAALTALESIGTGRRTWAVLGRIAELGETSAAAHAEVAAFAREHGVDELVAVGAPEYGAAREAPDVAAALDLLRAELRPGDVVLVKASRSAGLERLAAALLEEAS